jgi:hypothetical protein
MSSSAAVAIFSFIVVFPYFSLLDTIEVPSIVYQRWHYNKQARYQKHVGWKAV